MHRRFFIILFSPPPPMLSDPLLLPCSPLTAYQILIPNFARIHNIISNTSPHIFSTMKTSKNRSLCLCSDACGWLPQSVLQCSLALLQTLCCTTMPSIHIPNFYTALPSQSASIWVALPFSALLFQNVYKTSSIDSVVRSRALLSCLHASYCIISCRH